MSGLELDDENPCKAWIRWRMAWGRKPPINGSPAGTSASTFSKNAKPLLIPSARREGARKQLRSTVVKQFNTQQFYVFNREQSLANIERREKTPYSTRGLFF